MSIEEKPERSVADDVFGPALKTVREAANITQEGLAESMQERGFDFHQATIYKIESGRRRVSVGEGIALADLLGTSLDLLTTSDPTGERSSRRAVSLQARWTAELIRKQVSAMFSIDHNQTELLRKIGELEDAYGKQAYEFDGLTMYPRDFFAPLTDFVAHMTYVSSVHDELGTAEEGIRVLNFLGLKPTDYETH